MKKILYTLIPMMLMACGGGKKSPQDGGHGIGIDSATVAQTNAEDADYVPQRSDYSFRSDVRTITEEGEVFWDTIVVYLTDAKGHTQELYTKVGTGPMNGFGNYTYDVWLWNDKVHKFEELKYNGEIYSPSIDSDNKCIVSFWRLDDDVEIVRYKWKDGKLVESEREQMSASDLADD